MTDVGLYILYIFFLSSVAGGFTANPYSETLTVSQITAGTSPSRSVWCDSRRLRKEERELIRVEETVLIGLVFFFNSSLVVGNFLSLSLSLLLKKVQGGLLGGLASVSLSRVYFRAVLKY